MEHGTIWNSLFSSMFFSFLILFDPVHFPQPLCLNCLWLIRSDTVIRDWVKGTTPCSVFGSLGSRGSCCLKEGKLAHAQTGFSCNVFHLK